MARADKYAVFMKMLEIIERETTSGPIAVPQEQMQQIITIIGGIEGNLLLQQIPSQEVNVNIGDRFENINQSIIATRGSIATGIIKVRSAGEQDIANALEELEKAIGEAPSSELEENSKLEAFQLLGELVKQASSPTRAKPILKTLGNGLWEAIKHIDSISKTAMLVWPVIQCLWT